MQRQALLGACIGRTGWTVEAGDGDPVRQAETAQLADGLLPRQGVAGGSGQGFREGVGLLAEEAFRDRLGAEKGAEPQQLGRFCAEAPEGDGEGG